MSEEPTPATDPERGSASDRGPDPRPVEILERALADWLSAYTVAGELAGEMADACAAGAAWPAAVAALAAREAGWNDVEAMAWGIAVGAQAGALEAARRSLESEAAVEAAERPTPADGPAAALLASDALVAGAHEALSSLSAERLAEVMEALERAWRGGGPWLAVPESSARPAWRAVLPLALAPLGEDRPSEKLDALVVSARERASSDRPPS